MSEIPRAIAGRSVRRCKSCKAPIVWFTTQAGKGMPVDFASVSEGDTVYDPKKHKSHFATCPQADEHRKKEQAP